MSDECEPGQYESEPTRVAGGSGRPWLAIWGVVAVAVVSIGLAGTLMTQPAPSGPQIPVSPQEAAVAMPSPSAAPPSPSVPPRPSASLVVTSTDFYANGGAAYYGIGGRLIRALAPVPTRTANPGDAPD
jgi:hypothetical protein